MKTTKTISIPFVVSFDDWDENPRKLTKEELKDMAIKFLYGCSPMSQMTLGKNSGDLTLKVKQ